MRIKSSQARKQRLTVYEMPSHHRKKLVSVTLSKDLRKEIGARNIVVRKGDTIKVLRGSHRDKKGVVAAVDRMHGFVQVQGINIKKVDGKEIPAKLTPSNLIITDIDTTDKKRFKNVAKGKTIKERAPKKIEEPKKKEEKKEETAEEKPKKEEKKAEEIQPIRI